MALIIDGYNLLFASGIYGEQRPLGTLQREREALLEFLAQKLPPDRLRETAVVFDASDAPPGLPRKIDHEGITVHFASNYAEADEQIEELIRADHAPRRLTVVSSDHRLQRAARRRRATAVDSDVWYNDTLRRPSARQPEPPVKPERPLTSGEVDYWLQRFSEVRPAQDDPRFAHRHRPEPPPSPAERAPAEKPAPPPPVDDPFPPGYFDDLDET